jgi:hypothetical protein
MAAMVQAGRGREARQPSRPVCGWRSRSIDDKGENDMSWRILALAAAGAASILGTNLATSQSAEAQWCFKGQKICHYAARDEHGRAIARGTGCAVKKKRACKRAKRRCERNLGGRRNRATQCRRE